MPDQPAEKIAEILRRHFFIANWNGEGCGCNSWRGPIFDWYEHLASELVSELGLTVERQRFQPYRHDGMGSRYVTEWVPE